MIMYTALDESTRPYEDTATDKNTIESNGSYNIRPHTAVASVPRLASNSVVQQIRGSRQANRQFQYKHGDYKSLGPKANESVVVNLSSQPRF
jgi:hypothetical protein